MKRLNRIDILVGSLTLISAIIIQTFIFFEHDAEWYRNFYYILGAFCIAFFFCIGYCLFAIFKSKRYLVNCVLLLCIGMIVSIQQYRYAITHIDPSESMGGMNYFAFAPLVICSLLSVSVFVYAFLRKDASFTKIS